MVLGRDVGFRRKMLALNRPLPSFLLVGFFGELVLFCFVCVTSSQPPALILPSFFFCLC